MPVTLVNPGQQVKEAQSPEVPAEEQDGADVDVGFEVGAVVRLGVALVLQTGQRLAGL